MPILDLDTYKPEPQELRINGKLLTFLLPRDRPLRDFLALAKFDDENPAKDVLNDEQKGMDRSIRKIILLVPELTREDLESVTPINLVRIYRFCHGLKADPEGTEAEAPKTVATTPSESPAN